MACEVAQVVGPGFKSQYCTKRKTKTKRERENSSLAGPSKKNKN
jgi:hypothetical protein